MEEKTLIIIAIIIIIIVIINIYTKEVFYVPLPSVRVEFVVSIFIVTLIQYLALYR
jgi:hypothetical protein